MPDPRPIPTLRTGIPELDVVLRGGLPKHRLHLIEGALGTGKTALGLRFLPEGQLRASGASTSRCRSRPRS